MEYHSRWKTGELVIAGNARCMPAFLRVVVHYKHVVCKVFAETKLILWQHLASFVSSIDS
ncbi:hypothetical protein SDC9_185373 [bioreactor metagenome]|uniref:Uncharacterized protein n=1 Tax=bioreactor metagenome TaxID=1076179 RepID=A0A645HHI6_9ZZZZ